MTQNRCKDKRTDTKKAAIDQTIAAFWFLSTEQTIEPWQSTHKDNPD